MLEAIYIIALILILFGLTIFVHELGHFMVAKWCGLKIEAFSIGFGPPLFQKTINGVKYKIGILPFGGYVALPQMDPTLGADPEDDKAKELPAVTPVKKILVSVAGVIMNMILAFAIAYLISIVGMPASPEDYSSEVGYVDPDGILYEQGLRIGDEIISVDDELVKTWKDFMMITALKNEATLTVKAPDGSLKEIEVTSEASEGRALKLVGGVSGRDLAKVMYPIEGSSAAEAGVLAGDLLVEFNGEPIMSQIHLIKMVEQQVGNTVPLVVDRDGEQVALQVTPAFDEETERVLIGIRFNNYFKDTNRRIYPSAIEQMKSHAWLILRMVKAFVTPGEAGNAARGVGGPFAIFYMFWLFVKTDLMMALWLTALINVNLAIINMLPLPILDGGHIMFSLFELIFRRPVPPKLVYALSNIFFVLLISAMLFLSYRDIFKFIIPTERSMRDAAIEAPVETNSVDDVQSTE